MNKYLHKLLRISVILLTIFIILYSILFIYISANKQKIIKQVTDEISKKLNGNVSIGDVEMSFFTHFPHVSVLLHDVTVTDTMFSQHHHPFFKGGKVFINVDVVNLITKKSYISGFTIEDGSFYLFTDTSGYTNRYLFNQKRDSVQSAQQHRNELRKIVLNDVSIILDDRQKHKLHNIMIKDLDMKLDDKDSTSFLFSVNMNLDVHSLAFNPERGSFIKEKNVRGNFDLKFDKILKQLQFDSINLNVSGQPFNITARFDLAGPDPQFLFRLHTHDITYPVARSLLTEKISTAISIASVDKPLDADASISGPLKEGDPLVFINWSTKDAHLVTPFLEFDNASFKGLFMNEVVKGEPRKDPNSKIVVTNFSATWQDLPVTCDNIEVMNLVVPLLTCDLRSNFPLTTLSDIIGSNSVRLKSGNGFANLTYRGPLAKNTNTNSFVNGSISFKNGLVLYAPRNVEMSNVNGKLLFKNSDIFIQDLECVVLNHKLVMQGEAKNILTLISTEPHNAKVDWTIYTPELNLSSFLFLLKSQKKMEQTEPAKRKLAKMANSIDQVLERGSLNVNLRTPKLIYKKFQAQNVNANISLLQDRYVINDVSMDHAEGHMDLKGSVVLQEQNNHHAEITTSLDNVDVSRIFAAFDNFGQDGITSENLQGKMTSKVNAEMNIDDDGKIYPGTLKGVVDFSLKEGALINYEPVKKLQNFLFKNRDFENIRFAELKDRLEITNQEVKINRMEIQSSVMSMFVEGVYSKKGNTDLSIQVPLSNIHKRKADISLENIGVEKKGGSSIFIRGRPGPDGNIKFKLDLFNKFKKEKEKSELTNN